MCGCDGQDPIYYQGKFVKLVGLEMKVLGGNGYVELQVDTEGNMRYYLDGKLHRNNGPAIVSADGQYMEWYINGKRIHPAWLETRRDELGLGDDNA